MSNCCANTTLIRLNSTIFSVIWHSQHVDLFVWSKEIFFKVWLLQAFFFFFLNHYSLKNWIIWLLIKSTDQTWINFIWRDNLSRSELTQLEIEKTSVHKVTSRTTEHSYTQTTLRCISALILLALDCNINNLWVKNQAVVKEVSFSEVISV